MAVLVLIDHLLVRQGSLCLRVPVHHAYAAVDVTFLVEVDENLDDALRTGLVHGEGSAVPVAGATQSAQLLQDDAAVLVGPVPGVLEELLAREVGLLDALFGQTAHDLSLGGNRGVVGTRHPAGVLALHAGAANQNVLDGVVEHVAHVQHTRHIGGRNHNGIGLTAVGAGAEKFVVQPVLIPLALHVMRVVFAC